MAGLMDAIQGELGGQSLSALAGALGADQGSTQKAIAAALPALIGGLSRNAETPEGAQALDKALAKDHSQPFSQLGGLAGLAGMLSGGKAGGGLSGLAGMLGAGGSPPPGGGSDVGSLMGAAASLMGGAAPKPPAAKGLDGAGILGHILGARQNHVNDGVAKASGLDAASVQKLLPMLAPLVMSALGTVRQEKGLDGGGVAQFLHQEKQQIQEKAPASKGMMALLDRDGDGSMMDELAELGGQLSGSGLMKGLFG